MPAAELLRRARSSRGLSQRELAAAVGTSQSAIARYESGSVVPGFDTLERILRVLNHRIVLQPLPEPTAEDVALAAWFLSLGVEERIDTWENWLQLVDEAEVVT